MQALWRLRMSSEETATAQVVWPGEIPAACYGPNLRKPEGVHASRRPARARKKNRRGGMKRFD